MRAQWPGPGSPASRTDLLSAAASGVVAALTLVLSRPGIGWLIAGLAVAGIAVASAWEAGQRRPLPGQLGWGLAALALLAVGAVRAEGWLFVYCVLGALLAGSLALAGGRTVPGLAAGMMAGTVAVIRSLDWAVDGAQALRRPRVDRARVGLAALAAVGLVAVFGTLLASADPAFRTLLTGASPHLDPASTARALFCFLAGVFVALSTGYLTAHRPTFDAVPALRTRPVKRVEWAVPLAALDALFLVFAVVQFRVFLGGRWHGTDYARYTRSGFWQLVAVTVLTLVVLAVATRVAPREDKVLLRVLLGALAALALVIVASALWRLGRYEQAYGWTRLRVLIGAVEIWLGLLFVLVLAAGVRLRAGWLPRAAAGTAVAGLLVVALASPDRFIADRNVDRYQRTGDIDLYYLSTLSADAVPALDRLPAGLRSCALNDLADQLAGQHDDWRSWNLGRAQARAVIAAGEHPSFLDCIH
jgi:Domain of unknown function (DUF4153)